MASHRANRQRHASSKCLRCWRFFSRYAFRIICIRLILPPASLRGSAQSMNAFGRSFQATLGILPAEDTVSAEGESFDSRTSDLLFCTLTFKDKNSRPNVIDLCSACRAVTKGVPTYSIFTAQCYFFATATFLVLEQAFGGAYKATSDINRRGKYAAIQISWLKSSYPVALSDDLQVWAPPPDSAPPDAQVANAVGPVRKPLPKTFDDMPTAGKDKVSKLVASAKAEMQRMLQKMGEVVMHGRTPGKQSAGPRDLLGYGPPAAGSSGASAILNAQLPPEYPFATQYPAFTSPFAATSHSSGNYAFPPPPNPQRAPDTETSGPATPHYPAWVDSRSHNPAINLYGPPLPAAATAGRSLASAQASVFPLPPTAFAPFNPSQGFASCAAPGFGPSEPGPAGYPSSIGEASSRSGQQGCGGSSYLAPSPQVSRADPYSSKLPQGDRRSGSPDPYSSNLPQGDRRSGSNPQSSLF
jgi:hypothetical protein